MKVITIMQSIGTNLAGAQRVLANGTRLESSLLRVVTGLSDYRSINNSGRLGSENDGFTGQPVALLGGGMV